MIASNQRTSTVSCGCIIWIASNPSQSRVTCPVDEAIRTDYPLLPHPGEALNELTVGSVSSMLSKERATFQESKTICWIGQKRRGILSTSYGSALSSLFRMSPLTGHRCCTNEVQSAVGLLILEMAHDCAATKTANTEGMEDYCESNISLKPQSQKIKSTSF